MAPNLTIELAGLHFFAYHGFYAEERKTGNEFEVNLSVSFTPLEEIINGLNVTVNYELLYAVVKEHMQVAHGLLETLAMKIAEAIHSSFPLIRSVDISITKLHVPVIGFTGNVCVKFSRDF